MIKDLEFSADDLAVISAALAIAATIVPQSKSARFDALLDRIEKQLEIGHGHDDGRERSPG